MVKLGRITKAQPYEKLAWVSNLVIVEKKPNSSLRVCLDPKHLNEAIVDETFPIPSFEEIILQLAGMKCFCVFDLKDGFYQITLDDSSKKLCAF